MSICVVVLKEKQEASELKEKLINSSTPNFKFVLINPSTIKGNSSEDLEETNVIPKSISSVEFESIPILNPKLTRKRRQRTMAFWLMPFGFIAGLTFTKMTHLQTFTEFGISPNLDPLLGSFLGMGSGWIGSHAAASSVSTDKNDDIRSLKKMNEEGLWLLIIETPIEAEIPWYLIQEKKPINIIKLRDF